jgi:hypothetical protein
MLCRCKQRCKDDRVRCGIVDWRHRGNHRAAVAPENWGTWSVQKRCVLRFDLGQFTGRPLSIMVACRVFQYRNLQVGCYVEGGPIQRWHFAIPEGDTFATQEAKELCRLRIDREVIPPSGDLSITFLIPDSASPAELGLSADDRRLGIGLERMWIEDPGQ